MHITDNQTTSTFRNNSGVNIFYRNWKTSNNAKAIVLLVHGFNSHSGYYENFAQQLVAYNFEVYALDLCGRGNSEGERYFIDDYCDTAADINELVCIAGKQPPLPIFLFGHSAGGLFAAVYSILYQGKLQGLICESFAFHLPAPGFALAAIKFLAHFIPHTRLVKLNNKDFSRNHAIVDAMNNDRLLENEKQPVKTMQQLILAAEYLKSEMREIKLPLLILHGTSDKATKPSGSKYFMEHASSVDKELKLYEGHFHDLLNDWDNAIVTSDILHWLKQRV